MRKLFAVIAFVSVFGCFSYAQKQTTSFDFTYSVNSQPPLKGGGRAVIQDDCFHVVLDGVDYCCDGTTMWIVDPSAKEVYIQEPEDFSRYLQTANLTRSGEVVTGAEIKLEDGSKATLRISNYSVSSNSEYSFRVNERELPKDYIVTDLR